MSEKKIIYIGGREVEIPNLPEETKVITFKDHPEFSFYAAREHSEHSFLRPRLTKKFMPVRSEKDLKETINLIVMHTDVTIDSHQCFRVLVLEGYSTHFNIDWDGTIYQHIDPKDVAFHAGVVNTRAVGIDFNNYMINLRNKQPTHSEDKHKLEQVKGRNGYVDDPNSKFYRPIYKPLKINGSLKQTYGFTDAQYQSAIALFKVLCNELDIPKLFPANERSEVIPMVIEDQGFSGIAAHWHFSSNRWDPGPSFDWVRLIAGINNENNSFPLILKPGQNIANLLRRDLVEKAAEEFYRNSETTHDGGYYPIGMYQNWHDGIHLYADEGKPVYNMIDGKIVAMHFSSKETSLGSNNFILMKHEIPIPSLKKLKKGKPNIFKFYSLYMHLGPVVFDKKKSNTIWMSKMFQRAQELGLKIKVEGGGKPDQDDDDSTLTIEDLYLDWGTNIQHLIKGKAIVLKDEWDLGVIPAGSVIGTVGNFGSSDESTSMIHVEIFTDDTWRNAVDMNKHGVYWYEADEDMKKDLICDSEDILSMIMDPDQHYKLTKRREEEIVLSPMDITTFFSEFDTNSDIKQYLRKSIVRHVSEWSDQVDWISTLTGAEKWDESIGVIRETFTDNRGKVRKGRFSDLVREYLPFIWLNQSVAKDIGIEKDDWDGILYYFHPIYFLLWLTYHSARRIQSLSSGMSVKKLQKMYEQELSNLEAQRNGTLKDELKSELMAGNILPEVEVFDESPKEVFEEIKNIKKFPNDWRL